MSISFIYKHKDGRIGKGWSAHAAMVNAIGIKELGSYPRLLPAQWEDLAILPSELENEKPKRTSPVIVEYPGQRKSPEQIGRLFR